MIKNKKTFLRRTVASLLSTVFFINTVFASKPEADFWKERHKSVELAQLPQASAAISAIKQQLPVNSTLAKRLAQLPATSAPTIIHIQDVHMNAEAQKDISETIQTLLANKEIDLIALEGAFGEVDLKSIQRYPHKNITRIAADYLLREKVISGALHAALLSETPPVVGIDDSVHYQANVQAFIESRSLSTKSKEDLADKVRSTSLLKTKVFNGKLAAFDQRIEAYQKGQIKLGDYVRLLSAHVKRIPPQGEAYLRALNLESTLNLRQIESERTQVLSQLLIILKGKGREELIQKGLAYQMGKVSHADFYGFLNDTCQKKGLDLHDSPAMKAYLEYVALADHVDVTLLFRNFFQMEKDAYEELSQNDEERLLIKQSRHEFLSGKLMDFALTKEEWKEYGEMKRSGSAFEDFYREADARDQLMAQNLLKQIKKSKAKTVILIAGGYHSQGIQRCLAQAGMAMVQWTPKITKIETVNGSEYLNVFAQEKSPLEKLFEGEKLFLSPLQWTLPQKIETSLTIVAAEEASNPIINTPEITDQSTFEACMGDKNIPATISANDNNIPSNGVVLEIANSRTGSKETQSFSFSNGSLSAESPQKNKAEVPQRIYEFYLSLKMDDGSEQRFYACRVQDNNTMGPYKGGLRLHPQVDRKMITTLAREMTEKLALMELPLGGGKGGIRVDPALLSEAEKERLIRGYVDELIKLRAVGPDTDVPAPDVGSNAHLMEIFADEYIYETTHHQYHLRDYLKKFGTHSNDGHSLEAVVTGKPVESGGIEGREEATGLGVYFTTREAVKFYKIGQHHTEGEGVTGLTVAIQGLGNVGFHTANFLFRNGAKVIAIGENYQKKDVVFYDAEGINVPKLKNLLNNKTTFDELRAQGFNYREESGVNALFENADIVIPAAMGNQLTIENINRLSPRVKMLVEAANGPTTDAAVEYLKSNRQEIVLVPDILANAGGVFVSYLEYQANKGLLEDTSVENVHKKLEEKMTQVSQNLFSFADNKKLTLKEAAVLKANLTLEEARQKKQSQSNRSKSNRLGLALPFVATSFFLAGQWTSLFRMSGGLDYFAAIHYLLMLFSGYWAVVFLWQYNDLVRAWRNEGEPDYELIPDLRGLPTHKEDFGPAATVKEGRIQLNPFLFDVENNKSRLSPAAQRSIFKEERRHIRYQHMRPSDKRLGLAWEEFIVNIWMPFAELWVRPPPISAIPRDLRPVPSPDLKGKNGIDITNMGMESKIKKLNRVLRAIKKEDKKEGSSHSPEVVYVSDQHGTIDKFDALILYALRSILAENKGLWHRILASLPTAVYWMMPYYFRRMTKQLPSDFELLADRSIEANLMRYGLTLHDFKGKLFFHNLGDWVDRGPYGLKIMERSFELFREGISDFVIGNHDYWMFLNLSGYHLPTHSGFNFHDYTDSYDQILGPVTEMLKKHHEENPDTKTQDWWAEKFAQMTKEQENNQKTTWSKLDIEIGGEYDGKGKRISGTGLYGSIEASLTSDQKELWNALRGYRHGTEIFSGTRAVESVSFRWWEDLLVKFEKEFSNIKEQPSYSHDKPLPFHQAWIDGIDTIKNRILPTLRLELKNKLEKGEWWWRIFEAINYKNYDSVEWWAKDWIFHAGWGSSVIKESNESLPESAERVTTSNYLKNKKLIKFRDFMKSHFALFQMDIYLNKAIHGFLPIDQNTFEFFFEYKGVTYKGKQLGTSIWDGLQLVAKDIRESDSLTEVPEAIALINTWYADNTTQSKKEAVAAAINDFGPDRLAEINGFSQLFSGHIPFQEFDKLRAKEKLGIMDAGFNILGKIFFTDHGMAKKFEGRGAMVMVSLKKGIRLVGFRSSDSKTIEENVPTVRGNETLFLNEGVSPRAFRNQVRSSIREFLKNPNSEWFGLILPLLFLYPPFSIDSISIQLPAALLILGLTLFSVTRQSSSPLTPLEKDLFGELIAEPIKLLGLNTFGYYHLTDIEKANVDNKGSPHFINELRQISKLISDKKLILTAPPETSTEQATSKLLAIMRENNIEVDSTNEFITNIIIDSYQTADPFRIKTKYSTLLTNKKLVARPLGMGGEHPQWNLTSFLTSLDQQDVLIEIIDLLSGKLRSISEEMIQRVREGEKARVQA